MQAMTLIEKSIVHGCPLALLECTQLSDSIILPLIHNRNTALLDDMDKGMACK